MDSSNTIRILDVLEETMADGPGLRTSIYCAGCLHHCPGCHNPQSWAMDGGREVSIDELLETVLSDEFSNVTFSGGDPFYQVEAFTELARRIKEKSGKTIWCYTGFTYEEIIADERLSMLLPYIDVLVDGPFILSLRDTELLFRGSSNQRIIYLHGAPEDDSIPGTVDVISAK
ncbi:MAG: anaerobic ribonucleoside-triphosphate reductase activating protein [Candidatus Cryptobacteroides sp.]